MSVLARQGAARKDPRDQITGQRTRRWQKPRVDRPPEAHVIEYVAPGSSATEDVVEHEVFERGRLDCALR